jgi:hypothetical protein
VNSTGQGHGFSAGARLTPGTAAFSSTLRLPGETKRDRLSRAVEMCESAGDDVWRPRYSISKTSHNFTDTKGVRQRQILDNHFETSGWNVDRES